MENKATTMKFQVWTGFEYDEMEPLLIFDNKEDAYASAENCYDFAEIVDVFQIDETTGEKTSLFYPDGYV